MIKFEFKEISDNKLDDDPTIAQYSDSCSGERSDCCTRVCTRNEKSSNENSLEIWDKYLEVEAGVLQY